MTLFTGINNREYGISSRCSIENSSSLIEKLTSTPAQSHSLSSNESGLATSPNAVSYSHDLTGHLSVGTEDGGVHIYDTLQNKFLIAWTPHRNAILDVSWVPHVPKIVSCSVDTTVIVSDAWRAQPEFAFIGHTGSVRSVDVNREEPTTFATGGRDGMVMVWDVRCSRKQCNNFHPVNVIDSFRKEASETKHHVRITSVKFIGDRKLVVCGDTTDVIKVWDTRRTYTTYKRDPLPIHTLCPEVNQFAHRGYTCLSVDQGCTSLYASGVNGVIRRFCLDLKSRNEQGTYYGHSSGSFYIRTCLSPNGKWLLSGSLLCCKAHMWDVAKPGNHAYTLECGSSGEILSVAWSSFAIDNLVVCSDNEVIFWNMKSSGKENKENIFQIHKNDKMATHIKEHKIADVTKSFKSTTLDNFLIKPQLDVSATHKLEIKKDDLNEIRTTSSMVESMQQLTVETAPTGVLSTPPEPINSSQSLAKTKYSITNYFHPTGKGLKRKHSDESIEI